VDPASVFYSPITAIILPADVVPLCIRR